MLKLDNISKSYKEFSIDGIDFTVNEGEYFVILGPSGAGKSIILEIIAGLVKPDSGDVLLNRRLITQERIQNRKIGMLFQDYAVFPHMTVFQNIEYGLKSKPLSKIDRRGLINRLSLELNINHLLQRKSINLSGGEKQRVALARILAVEPACLLLDEPLSSVDTSLKEELWELLKGLHASGQTIVHVTHDLEEAMILADRIAVINDGKMVQLGTKKDIIERPGSKFLASFIGIKNYFSAEIKKEKDKSIALLDKGISLNLKNNSDSGRRNLYIRSEDIGFSFEEFEGKDKNVFKGSVNNLTYTKNGIELEIDFGIKFYVLANYKVFDSLNINIGDTIYIRINSEDIHIG